MIPLLRTYLRPYARQIALIIDCDAVADIPSLVTA